MKPKILLPILFVLIFLVPVYSGAQKIKWFNYQDGFKKAKAEHKKIFLNFYANW